MFKFGIYKEKTVWTRIHIKQLFCNFEYFGLQKRLNIFWGFEEKTRFHQVRETEREYGVKLRNDAKIAIFEVQPYFLNWNELKLKFSFIAIFTSDKIDPKVIGFFALPLQWLK